MKMLLRVTALQYVNPVKKICIKIDEVPVEIGKCPKQVCYKVSKAILGPFVIYSYKSKALIK